MFGKSSQEKKNKTCTKQTNKQTINRQNTNFQNQKCRPAAGEKKNFKNILESGKPRINIPALSYFTT